MLVKWLKRRREIQHLKEQIEEVENRLHRSHSACMQAMIEGKKPPEEEMKWHSKYMDEIRELRKRLQELEGTKKKA